MPLVRVRPRPAFFLARLLVATGALAYVAPAGAAKLAVVSRAVGPGSDKAAALVGHYAKETLLEGGSDEIVDLTQVLGNLERDKVLRRFSAAEANFQKAREAFATLELDAADDNLRACLARYERHAGYVRDYKKVAEALMLLGAVRVLRGDERSGSALFEQAITVFPEVEPDPRIFNPAMRLQFSQTAERLGARAKGTLSLNSSPGAAPVYVDNKFVGVTPVVVENLVEGRHFVRIEREGHRPWGKVIAVTGGDEASDNALLGPALHYAEFEAATDKAVRPLESGGDANEAARLEAAQALIDLAQADAVFLAAVRLDGERVRVVAEKVGARDRRLPKPAEHVFAYEPRIETYGREVAVMLRADFGAEPQAAAPASQNRAGTAAGAGRRTAARDGADAGNPGKTDGPGAQAGAARSDVMAGPHSLTTKRIVAGTFTGAGAASIIVGGVEWILAKRTHDQWRKTPQATLDASGRHYAQSVQSARGRNQALTGDLLVGLGGASLLVGILTWSLWHPDVDVDEVERPEAKRRPERAAFDLQIFPYARGAMVMPTVHF